MNKLFEIESLDQFKRASEEVVNELNNSKSSVDLAYNITQAKEELKLIISSNDFDMTKVSTTLQNRQWNSERVDFFISLLEEKYMEILYSTLLNHNSKLGETVTNFDWRLKLVLGSSELKTLKYPLLQLVLATSSSVDQKKKMYEMHKDMLKRFIEVLETAVN